MGRTLVLTSTYPQWEADPRGAFIRRHWEAQARAGEHVEVLAPRTRWCRGTLGGPLLTHRFAYAPRAWSSLSGQFGILENLREAPRRGLLVPPFLGAMVAALRRQLDRADAPFDRVVAHMVLPCGVAASLAAGLTAPKVRLEVYGHGTDVDLLLGAPRALDAAVRSLLAPAQTLHLPSLDKARRLRDRFPELGPKLSVQTMAQTVEAPADLVRRPVPGRVLYLGRLIAQKGVDRLIRAVTELARQSPQRGVHLQIAGDGPERGRLVALARRTGAPVTFLGFVEGAAKAEALATAACLCVPSRDLGLLSEGAPLVIREASVLGIPVVATAVGGIPELASSCPGPVRLVPPNDARGLVEALRASTDPLSPLSQPRGPSAPKSRRSA